MNNDKPVDEHLNEIEGRVADAVRGHWADHFLPTWFRPYARLSRLERPIGWWLLFWPCLWSLTLAVASGASDAQPALLSIFHYMLAFWVGSVAMRGAGCTYNDLVDHKIDEMVERTRSRPLPSNQVTRKKAWIWLGLQLLVGLLVLLQFNAYTIALGLSSLWVVAIYPFMKRITNWPQLVLGLAFSWGALVGWSAITGSIALAPILMYIGSIAWTIGYDTIYAHQDREDDVMIGVKSTALLFADHTKQWLIFFYSIMILMMLASFVAAGAAWPAFVGLAIAAGHMGWQIRILDIDNSDQCLALFKSNSQIGWLIMAGLLLSMLA